MSYGVTRNQDGGFPPPQPGGGLATVSTSQLNVESANRANCGGTVYPANVPYHQAGPPREGVQSNGGYPGHAVQAHPLAPAYPPISHQPVPTNKGVMVQGADPAIQNGRRGQRQRTNDSDAYICCCVVCCVNPCDCDCDCCDGCDCDLM